ncbi:MAG: hypothetical protein PIR02_16100 [Microbacterium enclense]
MTTLEDQHHTMQAHVPALLHGDDTAAHEALSAILVGADNPQTFSWTMAQLVSIAAVDMRTYYAEKLASTPNGFIAFEQVGGEVDPAQAAAMRIVVAYANNETADAATLIRALIDNGDLIWAARVAIHTAQITRQAHAHACGGHR